MDLLRGQAQISKYLITEDSTQLQALQQMDANGVHVLFVVDENNCLKAAVSEGDIRRWILSAGALTEPVKTVANYNPMSLTEAEAEDAARVMRKRNIQGIPVVNDSNQVVEIRFWSEINREKGQLNIPVVMMAGGKGTRLYPYTKILPKPLIPVGEQPIAEIIMDKFHESGVDDFYLIVNHKKNMIKAYFNETSKEYSIKYADEDVPLGTGGGLKLLSGKIKTPFILTNCDILIEEDFEKIYKHHAESKNKVTMVASLRNFQVAYGVVEIGEHGEIEAMKEKPEFSFFTNTGSYIVEPEVIDEIAEGEFIGFPDVIQRIKDKGGRVGVYPINESAWMDMGQMDELQKMEARLKNE
ncbi:MAG: CBS domain-containing protein [Pseudobutyrivibrio sp.]|nr:CBS domain-containing protein [Pseudobutyrivibrio sp.]